MDKNTIKSLDEVYHLLTLDNVKISDKYSFIHKKTKDKSILMSIGRIWFNLILPDDFRLINEEVDKSRINNICFEIYKKYPIEEVAKYISKIGRESFKMSSIIPTTFNSESLILSPEIKSKKRERINDKLKPEHFSSELEKLAEEHILTLNGTNFGNLIDSKASGKAGPLDIAILTLAKGPVMDIEGKISKPITSSLMEGYDGVEYYNAASEARRAYFIRSSGTSEPGYLARQVVFANSNTRLDKDDCKTTKYFNLFVKYSNLNKIIGRYHFNEKTKSLELITEDSLKEILNKIILLRSPLFCKNKNGICKICYGKLSTDMNTKNIGLIAGGVLNQAGVEGYAMAARHQASQVNLRNIDFTKDIMQF